MIAAAPLLQPELRFDPESHSYFWKGERLPGVTEIIGSLGLIGGSDWFTEASAERGNDVHKTTLLYDEGRLDFDTLSDEMAGYLTAWIAFRAEHKFEPIHCELPLAHPRMGFAGTLDRIGLMGDVETLPDIKTMAQPCRKQKPHWALQLALYAWLARLNGFGADLCRINVILCPDGRYRIPNAAMDYEAADDLAECCLKLWRAKNGKH